MTTPIYTQIHVVFICFLLGRNHVRLQTNFATQFSAAVGTWHRYGVRYKLSASSIKSPYAIITATPPQIATLRYPNAYPTIPLRSLWTKCPVPPLSRLQTMMDGASRGRFGRDGADSGPPDDRLAT